MKKIKNIVLTVATFLMLFVPMNVGLATSVNAQDNLLCKAFPFLKAIGGADSATGSSANTLCGGGEGNTIGQVGSFIQFVLSLVFIGIIGVAIFYIIKSAIKYIRSEGDEGKVQESQKAIKAVFVGVAALFVGIIGLVIILVFFNAAGALQDDPTAETGEEKNIKELFDTN